ncbi:MAG: T9SS type A sorting domain-containing protein, partial [Balneolales bacterium]|nr:T9SS type A sorting domain-containing protein [Balneolales bacterium]
SLFQNYPSPFNPSTNIEFNLNKNETISLTVYDVMGRKVSTLVSGKNFSAGNHQLTFNASNLSSGIYFYQLEAGDIVQTKKMLLIK